MILLSLFLMFFGGTAHALSVDDQLEYGCYTEISFFCPDTQPKAASWIKCLEKHATEITSRCVTSMQSVKIALAPKPPETPQISSAPAAAPIQPPAALPGMMDARLTHIEGTVYVHMAGQPDDQFVAGGNDMPIDSGDLIRTGSDGKAELAVNADSVIDLSANTDFRVNQLSPANTEWRLDVGSIVAKIRSLVPGQQMQFVTPSAVAAIRGTELAIVQDNPDNPTWVGVLDEGKVSVTSASGGKAVVLNPGQETSVTKGQPPAQAKPLKSLAFARKEMVQIQKRVAEIKKSWKQHDDQAKTQIRKQFMSKPVPGGQLNKLSDIQKHLASPAKAAAAQAPQSASKGVGPQPGTANTAQKQQQKPGSANGQTPPPNGGAGRNR